MLRLYSTGFFMDPNCLDFTVLSAAVHEGKRRPYGSSSSSLFSLNTVKDIGEPKGRHMAAE